MGRIKADYFALPADQGLGQAAVVNKTSSGSRIYPVKNLKKLPSYSFRGVDRAPRWRANAMTFAELRFLPDGSKITIIAEQSYVSSGIRDASDRSSPQQTKAGSDSGSGKGEASGNRSNDYSPGFDWYDLQFPPGARDYLQTLDDDLSKAD